MRENEPVLLVLSVCDGEIILENGEILCEKRYVSCMCCASQVYLLLVAALSIQRVVFRPTSVVPRRCVHSDFEKGGLPKEPLFSQSTADHLAIVH